MLTQHLSAYRGTRGTVGRNAQSSRGRGRRRADSADISDRSVLAAVDGSPLPAVGNHRHNTVQTSKYHSPQHTLRTFRPTLRFNFEECHRHLTETQILRFIR